MPATKTRDRALENFLWELTRHHGVRFDAPSSAAAHRTITATDGTVYALRFGTGRSLTITEKHGRSAAVEMATFADYTRCQFAVSTFIQSAVER